MPLDFLFLYEHVAREYESLLLLKLELERRGYTCDIRQLLDRKKLKYFTVCKPRVIVTSNLYDNAGLNSHVYNNVGRLNRVVNLHWEQMLSDAQEGEAWFNFAGSAKQCVQTCWGEATRARLLAHGVPTQNAPVTGAVSMDFLRPEFAGYFLDKNALCARYGLNAAKPLLLYISSFGYASMDDAEVRQLSEMAGTDFTLFARVNRESMAQTLSWFDKYLSANPDVQLVYRRHPSEWNHPDLQKLAGKHPGFRPLFEDSVKQWITAADAIAVWMSSAVAEVYFAHKNCLVLRPQPIPHQFDPVIYKEARFIQSYIAFQRAADAALRRAAQPAAAPPFPIDPAVIEAYFSHGHTPAYLCMADLLEDVHQNPPRGAPFGPGARPRFNWLKCFALWGAHLLYALRLNPAPLSKLAGRIYGYIDKAHLSKRRADEMARRIRPFLHANPPENRYDQP